MGSRYERLKPGQVFGRLTVLEESAPPTEFTAYKGLWYRCRCQCGNTVVIRRDSLVSGNTKSCGCLRRDVVLERSSCERIATGQVFGRLTVIEEAPAPSEYTTYKGLWYRCRCQCGNTVVIRKSSLVAGNTKSCGCLRRDVGLKRLSSVRIAPGQVFGRLTVLEESAPPTEFTSYKGRWYRCRCQCGNEAVVRRTSLVGGRTKSCGCLQREFIANLNKRKEVRK